MYLTRCVCRTLVDLNKAYARMYARIDMEKRELDEQFTLGGGRGGTKLQSTRSCVILRDKSTGLQVRCQTTRDLAQNRVIAKQRLQRQIDKHVHGRESVDAVISERHRRRKERKQRRRRVQDRLHDDSIEL
jgi:protein subunit release factor B